MTLRRNRIAEKKTGKCNYTLDITESLPRPNYKEIKSKINEVNIPDVVENSLKQQIK